MTALTPPDVRFHETWAEALLDFGDEEVHGSGLWHISEESRHDVTEAACAMLVAELRRYADPEVVLENDMVHSDYYWVTEEGDDVGDDDADVAEVVGFLALRHDLNAWLLEEGGHIGYSVRPTRRREGHATRALALALRRAADLGIERALLTCDEDNLASARTIELNAGVYEDTRNGKRRYWIDTG